MERIEPRHEPDLQQLTFRRAPRWSEPVSDGRFSIGVAIFLLVALAYPWYSYWVQTRLLARDIEQGVEQLSDTVDNEKRQVSQQDEEQSRFAREQAIRQRIAAVRVTGVSEGSPPLAVVDLGQSDFLEADETICRQAGAWLHRSVSGKVIRVQGLRPRGSNSAINEMACP
jgi:hypothetical protein